MGILSYLGPLVIIPLLVERENSFVKFHIKQGLVLLVIEAAVSILQGAIWQFWPIYQIINFGVFVLVVIGIINVSKDRKEELPLVGQFAKYFTF